MTLKSEPGWYPDGTGKYVRYWDGERWTGNVFPLSSLFDAQGIGSTSAVFAKPQGSKPLNLGAFVR